MKPSRPYLLRALYEWVLDNNMTPHVVVDATVQGVQVPEQFVNDGQITLNIAPGAVQSLLLDDQGISFSARFGGVPMQVYVPIVAVLAIFTRENGMGMGFGMEPGVEELHAQAERGVEPPDDEPPAPSGGRPALRVVK
ncbi:ClpXP protease specificity-enhancing factor [Marinobacterium marinum]|uniref:ClpXP protease specificity-enhancing factor n=1 Tax=Marinobacterium marinum TaxID=2756129 RepID=A0A7W1WYN2_9GAMM|nr:ClpXP protease specificity-enhancing factor [Marinobacterium marinum]MBA4502477.1 ClpXP protease specificity-enhancing factor [Marinobacterium marinum]